MKTAKLFLVLLILLSFNSLFAQYAALRITNCFSRYARVIRMGDTYTGIASGIESVFYNPAGLAGYDKYGILYSSGYGIGEIYANTITPYDFAIAAPLPDKTGTVGFSFDNFRMDYGNNDSDIEAIYSLHLARKFSNSISFGISFNYSKSESHYTNINGDPNAIFKSNMFDMSISALYNTTVLHNNNLKDEIKFGLFMKNILNAKVSYSNSDVRKKHGVNLADYISQTLRTGTSYSITPDVDKYLRKYDDLDPLKVTLAFDAIFHGMKYEAYRWRPNYAIELSLYEILQLSFGRENEFEIKDIYSFTTQFPVNRYGFGLKLPVSKFLNLKNSFNIEINYCRSDWQKLDESKPLIASGSQNEIEPNAFSVSAAMGF